MALASPERADLDHADPALRNGGGSSGAGTGGAPDGGAGSAGQPGDGAGLASKVRLAAAASTVARAAASRRRGLVAGAAGGHERSAQRDDQLRPGQHGHCDLATATQTPSETVLPTAAIR
ncbi:MAG: hypothetical protein JO352_17080 [Chloroflexi bacterium]|nr:hypothetical protein [Chloroflexota bacterium]MBV9596836.1 hypothetical protein [Chloroflexota bacterium]